MPPPPAYTSLKQHDPSSPSSPSSSLLSNNDNDNDDDTTTYDNIDLTRPPLPTPWSTRRWLLTLFTSLLLTNTATLLITTSTILLSTHRPCHRKPIWEPYPGIAPYFSNISLDVKPVRAYAPFYDREDSIYRKHNSSETEVAWRELTQLDSGFMLLPKEQAVYAGIDPKRHVYWDEPEKGLVGYPVRLEATHELHCLNLIRRYSFFHYNYTLLYDADKMKDEPFHYGRLHLDHCIEYLRQRLMCLSDMNLLPYIWLGDQGDMVSDMTGTYMCRDYESVRTFIKRNSEKADGRVKPKKGELVLYGYV